MKDRKDPNTIINSRVNKIGYQSKYKENKQATLKESNTLDNKHRHMVKNFNSKREDKEKIIEEIKKYELEIQKLDEIKDKITSNEIKKKAELFHKR